MRTKQTQYFTYELITAANDWIDQAAKERRRAEKRFARAVENYYRELEEIKPRLSQSAWKFFRHGFAETGLHDGRLLSLTVGDGLNYLPDGTSPFRLNHQRASARVEFLNYEQTFRYSFELRQLKRAGINLYLDEPGERSLGDLYTYELTRAKGKSLRLGVLFASGADIDFEFRSLVFKRWSIRPTYDHSDIYR